MILGAVLVGGRSSRFGSDKAQARWNGRALRDHAAAAIAGHVDAVVAVGGAGVLDTGNFQRNISAQIDLFQAQQRPAAGVAVVVVSGNDYSFAADKDNSTDVRRSS